MKKIIILLFMLLGNVSLVAQSRACWQAGVYSGVNMEEIAPDLGGYLSVERFYIRGEIDVGWGNIRNLYDFVYVSPMVGFCIGQDFKCFGLAGVTNWGGIDSRDNTFKASYIVPRIKLGGEIPLPPCLCLSVYWNWNVPIDREEVAEYDYNAIMISLGVKF